jgi:hypothetical protein
MDRMAGRLSALAAIQSLSELINAILPSGYVNNVIIGTAHLNESTLCGIFQVEKTNVEWEPW